MPGLPGFVTTDNGAPYTRFRGPVLAGQLNPQTSTPIPNPGGFICVQSSASPLANNLTTADAVIARSAFMYIPVVAGTTGSLAGSVAPPYTACGTPLVWNDSDAYLIIYSSSRTSWMTLIATTSMGKGGFTTSE